MTVIINGTTGITTPAVASSGGDTNATLTASTSVTTPLVTNAGTVSLSATGANIVTALTNGTERMRIDSAGNVGIGTSSPSFPLDVAGAIRANSWIGRTNVSAPSGDAAIYRAADNTLGFSTASTERMRIDASGNLFVGTTGLGFIGSSSGFQVTSGGSVYSSSTSESIFARRSTNGIVIAFRRDATTVGSIDVTTTATSYVTSSDYRLKENIAPMTGALNLVQQLKPVTYNWKVDGSAGQGFIAHELQEVVPECVTGEKDAVETYLDEEGVEQTRPRYQGIDTSFLVATLTASIQELKAIVDAQAERILVLESK